MECQPHVTLLHPLLPVSLQMLPTVTYEGTYQKQHRACSLPLSQSDIKLMPIHLHSLPFSPIAQHKARNYLQSSQGPRLPLPHLPLLCSSLAHAVHTALPERAGPSLCNTPWFVIFGHPTGSVYLTYPLPSGPAGPQLLRTTALCLELHMK